MFTLFLFGLVLLVVLFTLKVREVRSGRVLFGSDLRNRADKWLSFQVQRLLKRAVWQAGQVRIFFTAHVRQLRNQLSDFFVWLAEQLR